MYSVFFELLKERNLKTIDVARATGISSATFSDWKSGRSVPKSDKMKLIADFFDVPVEYLMTGSHPAAVSLDPRRKDLLDLYERLNAEGKEALFSYLDYLVNTEKFQKKTPSSSRSTG